MNVISSRIVVLCVIDKTAEKVKNKDYLWNVWFYFTYEYTQSHIQSIIENARHEAKPARRDLQKTKFDFRQAITADHYEQKTIDQLAKRQGDDLTQLLRIQGKTQQAIKSVLNDQQRATTRDN